MVTNNWIMGQKTKKDRTALTHSHLLGFASLTKENRVAALRHLWSMYMYMPSVILKPVTPAHPAQSFILRLHPMPDSPNPILLARARVYQGQIPFVTRHLPLVISHSYTACRQRISADILPLRKENLSAHPLSMYAQPHSITAS